MRLRKRTKFAVLGAGLLALIALVAAVPTSAKFRKHDHERSAQAKHVLLLSVDGLHQSDLAWFVNKFPDSNLASLVSRGAEFTGAQTPVPSDSFPGMLAQATGGNPWTTGVYYDDGYSHRLLPPGTTQAQCASATPGSEVFYAETIAKDPLALDSGQGLPSLPDGILNLTGNPLNSPLLIDTTQLPVDPNTCKPVFPHDYLLVNTIFQVARQGGLRTAWSDKHVAYEVLNGPGTTPNNPSIQDLFTPEINSQASVAGNDWTTDNALTRQYDSYKVQAVINEIKGFDHSGANRVGEPALFGMNFQTVSTAEKLPAGGYMSDGVTPSPLLQGALKFIDKKLGKMLAAIRGQGSESRANGENGGNRGNGTVIILSAKHGQSPNDPSRLTRINDSDKTGIIKHLNDAWKAAGHTANLVAHSINDDGMYIWLTVPRSDPSYQSAADFARTFLLGYDGNGTGSDGKAKATSVTGDPKAYTHAGLDPLRTVAGAAALTFFTSRANVSGSVSGETERLSRVPDLVGVAQVGTVYTGGTKKIAEHGGANPQDLSVPLLVAGAHVGHSVQSQAVETTQIAPTILSLLGLNPHDLQAVQREGTAVLPF